MVVKLTRSVMRIGVGEGKSGQPLQRLNPVLDLTHTCLTLDMASSQMVDERNIWLARKGCPVGGLSVHLSF